jgi:hypothetical protein
VKRLLVVYSASFAASVLLFALFSWLAPEGVHAGWGLAIWRMLSFLSGGVCAAAAWGSAIWLANVHRTTWPLALAVLTICVATGSIVLLHPGRT